jgi:hypothetical protein
MSRPFLVPIGEDRFLDPFIFLQKCSRILVWMIFSSYNALLKLQKSINGFLSKPLNDSIPGDYVNLPRHLATHVSIPEI